jgi:hypothetical protein
LVRIPACHAGGRGFESRPLRQHVKSPATLLRGFFFAKTPSPEGGVERGNSLPLGGTRRVWFSQTIASRLHALVVFADQAFCLTYGRFDRPAQMDESASERHACRRVPSTPPTFKKPCNFVAGLFLCRLKIYSPCPSANPGSPSNKHRFSVLMKSTPSICRLCNSWMISLCVVVPLSIFDLSVRNLQRQ